MELISIRRFEFMSQSRRCGPAKCHRAQGSGTHRGVGRGQDKGPALQGSRKCFLVWIQCSFYLRVARPLPSLVLLKTSGKGPEAGDRETGPWFAAGGPSQYRQRLPPRPPAKCLGTRGFSRYSITHPTGVLPGYRPLCVASPWLL